MRPGGEGDLMCTGVGEGDPSTVGTPGGMVAVPSSAVRFAVAGPWAAAGLQPSSRPAAQSGAMTRAVRE